MDSRVEQLFQKALERPEGERTAYLAVACDGDDALRQEVESLLHHDQHAGSRFLQSPPVELMAGGMAGERSGPAGEPGADPPAPPSEPRMIGAYQLIRKLGQGGMGQVWLAEQTAPVRRRVALKLIRAGMYDEAMLARFQSERQSLAIMDHPAIAKVFDAGATPEGQPHFVMEYVDGQHIDTYWDEKKLTIRRRLELFIQVCEGVQHAHQKALIHRDLKPSNILVVEVDGKPAPRIIDFGLAKAASPQAPDEQMLTRTGGFVGTPGYMSPEQADPNVHDIDTRTDVYSLGVLLYVLLTGALPHDTQPLDQFLRRLREEDPLRPSTKVSSDGEALTTTAEHRQTQPKQLVGQLRGDLDWINMKALEKDRDRRYATPAGLAADLRRFLNNEPVVAAPPGTTYRARKYVRRHRVGVAVAAGLTMLLVGFSAVLGAQLQATRQERDRANRQAAIAQAVNDFLQNDLLGQASAYNQSKPDPHIEVRAVLDRAAQSIQGKFGKQPAVEAAIRDTIGKAYDDLGLYPEAERQLEPAVELSRRVLGQDNPSVLKSVNDLATLYREEGKYPQAEVLHAQALAMRRRALGPENPDTLASMNNLANVYTQQGKYAQAEVLHAQALAIRRRVLGPEHPQTLGSMNNLALVYEDEGKYPQAEALDSQVLEIRRHLLGPEHPNTLGSMNNLANVYDDEGKFPQAEALDIQLLQLRQRVLGPEHPDTLMSMSNLAVVYDDEGRYAEAAKLQNQTLEIRRRVLGPEHPATLNSMTDLAKAYNDEGKYARAEALYRLILAVQRRVLGLEHLDTLQSMNNLADAYAGEGKYAQAYVLFDQTLGIARRVLGPEHPETLNFLSDLALACQREGKYGLAETYAGQALVGRQHALGPENQSTIASAADLALAYMSRGRFTEAEPLARETLEAEKKAQPENWQRYRAASLLGASLSGEKKYTEAEPLLLEGYQGMLAQKDRIDALERHNVDLAHRWLVELYEVWGKPAKVAEWKSK